MATFSQLMAGVAAGVNLLQKPWVALAASGSADVPTLEAAALASTDLDSDLQAQRIGSVASQRAFYAAAVARLTAAGADLVASSLRQIGRTFDLVASVTVLTDALVLIPLLYTYMWNNGYRIYSRMFTRGTFTAIRADGTANVGNGTVLRLLVDRYGLPLESGSAQTITLRCVADANSGTAPGQELFTFNGQPLRDALARYDSGTGSASDLGITQGQPVPGIAANNSQAAGINNPSFSEGSLDGSGVLTLNGWTITGAAANQLAINTAAYYRASSIEGLTPASLQVNSGAAVTLTQNFRNNGQGLNQLAAYFAQLAVNRQVGAATVDVTVTVGSLSWAFSYTAEAGWQLLRPTIDKNLYFPNFNQETLNVSITVHVTSGVGTYALIDDLLFSPWSVFDGTFYAIVGGSLNFLFEDGGTIADSGTTSTKGIIQQWFAFTYGLALPAVPQTPSAAPAAALAGAGAGNVNNGAHSYAYTFLDAYGNESAPSATAVATVVNLAVDGKVAVSSIAAGPSGTVSRKVYRSVAATTTPLKLLTTIADNVTTTYTDNTADGSLGANAPTYTVIADPS